MFLTSNKIVFRGTIIIVILTMAALFQNCSQTKFATANSSRLVAASSLAVDCSFNGKVLTEGQDIVAYQLSTVTSGTTCNSEVRKCEGGHLSGSFAYANCAVAAPASCLISGRTIAHGESVTAYANSSVTFGLTCMPQTRTCQNGILVGGSGQFLSCTVGVAKSCTFNSQTIAHGAAVKAFQQSAVSHGSTCTSQDRVCNDGILTGNYTFGTCNVGVASSCNFNGTTVAHGAHINAYESATGSPECNGEVKTCNNGQLSGAFKYSSCSKSSYQWNSKSTVISPCSVALGFTCGPANEGQQLYQSFCGSDPDIPWTCDRATTTYQ